MQYNFLDINLTRSFTLLEHAELISIEVLVVSINIVTWLVFEKAQLLCQLLIVKGSILRFFQNL